MNFKDLNAADQRLLNTEFDADIEKEAAAKVALVQEMYDHGFDKLASSIADQFDKIAEESEKDDEDDKKDDDKMDDESEKTAGELGAFIEKGLFDGLQKLGSERHGDEAHYLFPYVIEKVAQEGAELAVQHFLKSAGAKEQFGKVMKKLKGFGEDTYIRGLYAADKAKAFGRSVKNDAKTLTHRNKGDATPLHPRVGAKERAKAGGRLAAKTVAPAAAAGGAAYGASKLFGKKKSDEAKAD